MTKSKRILVVADNLAEFRRANPYFDDLPTEWQVHYSPSESDAQFCIRHEKFDVVFVDFAAGPLPGAELLYDVRLFQPNAIRFLLGPSLDPEILLTCASSTHQFLQKPLDADKFKAALDRAELVHHLLRDNRIQALVSRIRIFPSRPKVYLDVIRELRSEYPCLETVGQLISQDLGISTKLLQVVNSAWFGLHQKVSSPQDAVLLLGTQTTASLILAIEVFGHLDHLQPNYFAIDQVWRHSQSVAQAAKKIAEALSPDPTVAHDAFTAGLLHDIGKLALAVNVKEEYGGVLRLARQKSVPVWQAEMDTFNTTHAAIGAYLLALWGLPCSIIKAVAFHHALASTLPFEFSAATAVHLANLLEYAKLPLRTTFPSFDPDLEYPTELGLDGYLEPLSTAVSGRDQGRGVLLNSPSHDTDFVLFSSSRKITAVG